MQGSKSISIVDGVGGAPKMRILHVMSSLSQRLGGPTQLLKLCEALAKRGVGVDVWTTSLDGRGSWFPFQNDKTLQAAVPVTHSDSLSVTYFPVSWPSRFKRSPALKRHLRSQLVNFDLVHIHGLYLYTTLVAARYARRYGKPYVIEPHGVLDPYILSRHRLRKAAYVALFERGNLDHAEAIHYASVREWQLAAPLRIRPRGMVVPLGVDLGEYSNLPRGRFRRKHFTDRANPLLIVFMGRICKKKGLDLLVPAFAKIARDFPAAHLVLAGPDDEGYGPTLRHLVAHNGIADRVTLPGMLEGADKLALLADADIWVLPSYSENFGIAVVEAMACRLPIIISDQVNICDDVASAHAGVVVSCEVNELRNAIAGLIRDPVRRARLGVAAEQLVSKSFTWDIAAGALLAEYRSILARRGSPLPEEILEGSPQGAST